LPRHLYISRGPFLNSAVIDATGEKIAYIGRVWNKDGSSKNINKVGFLFGSVTKAGGSGLTVSLQDVSLTSGPVFQPDETQDQTVAIANGDAGFTSNAWYQTGALSATRTVSPGDLLAVVIEYDGSGRLGADAVNVRCLAQADSSGFNMPGVVLKSGGSWSDTTDIPNVILEFDDGTFGTLDGGFPLSATSSAAFKQDTGTADEYAMEFSVPFPCKADGCWLTHALSANTSNYEIVLYEGTTVKTTVTVDANAVKAAGDSPRFAWFAFSSQISLTANTTYYLAVKPTQTTSTVTLHYFDVAAANHFQAHDGGTAFRFATRLDEGAWAAATTTRRPYMGIRLCAFDDGVGGGSGGGLKIVGCGGLAG